MTSPIPEKIKGFLFNPTGAFRGVRNEQPGETLKYFVAITAIYSILMGIMIMLRLTATHPFLSLIPSIDPTQVVVFDVFGVILMILVILALSFVFAVIFGMWLHIFVYLLGGRKGFWETEKSVFYNLTPTMLIGWIPVVGGLIGAIWSIILGVIGVRELHEMSTQKAAIAVLLAVIVAFVLLIVIAAAFLMAIVAQGPYQVI
jgi:hypothetical protein